MRCSPRLGGIYGAEARGPITNLTLFGGFSSTICWPLSAFMIEHIGWREACFVYAALHLVVALPLQMAVIGRAPQAGRWQRTSRPRPRRSRQPSRIANETLIFALLALVLSIAAGIGSIVVVHLLIFLQARGVDYARRGWPWERCSARRRLPRASSNDCSAAAITRSGP